MTHLITQSLSAAIAGGACVAGAMLVLVPDSVEHRRFLRLSGLVALLLGVGGLARVLGDSLSGSTEMAPNFLFRVQYATWAFAASLGAALLRLVHGPSIPRFIVLASPILVSLLVPFLFTPAFPEIGKAGDADSLALHWALGAAVGVACVLSGIPAVGFFLRSFSGLRTTRAFSAALVVGFLAIVGCMPMMAASDAGMGEPWIAAMAGPAVPAAWILVGLLLNRAEFGRMGHTLGLLRTDLDGQAVIMLRDPLTGVFNRSYFFEILHQSVERLKRTAESFAVCMIDIDDFKVVNDTHGHPVGDLVLTNVSKILMRQCRPYDTVARYGGEEFALLLRDVDENRAVTIADRMRTAVAAMTLSAGDATVSVTVTIGITVAKSSPGRAEDLVRAADEALYDGKHQGKNRVVVR